MRIGRHIACLAISLVGVATTIQARADICSSGIFSISKAEQIVAKSVTLINNIIVDPQAANMRNWRRLSDPHDETEIGFFTNSISDGTATVYSRESPIRKRVLRHSGSETDSAVVLQYLRLSLLAVSPRPGRTAPKIVVTEISPEGSEREIVAKGHLETYGMDAKSAVRYPLEIGFDLEVHADSSSRKNKFCLSLGDITIKGQKVFGWWRDL